MTYRSTLYDSFRYKAEQLMFADSKTIREDKTIHKLICNICVLDNITELSELLLKGKITKKHFNKYYKVNMKKLKL